MQRVGQSKQPCIGHRTADRQLDTTSNTDVATILG